MRAAKEEIACFQRDSDFRELQGESLSVRKTWGTVVFSLPIALVFVRIGCRTVRWHATEALSEFLRSASVSNYTLIVRQPPW